MNEPEITLMAEFILEIESLARITSYAEDRLIYERFLSYSAIILSKLVKEQPIGDDISTMEKLFGNTWLKDKESYSKAYTAWDKFKELFVRSIHGMTVNERLFNLGSLEDFDAAVEQKDEPKIRAVLFKCFLDEKDIEVIIKNEFNR